MNKRNILVFLAVSVTLILCFLLVFWFLSRTESDGNFEYTWSDELEGYYVSADKASYGEELVIPAEYEGKPVVAIAQKGFAGVKGFKTVVLPASVKKITYAAFRECPDLEVIDWYGSGVESIGNLAFYECDKLESFNFPANTKVVSNSMFYGCDSLREVTLSDGVLTIMERAFSRCTKLASVTIPKNVVKISDSAFYNCTALGEVEFAKDSALTKIGRQAFSRCQALSRLTFPEKLTHIGSGAFSYCTGLTFVSFTADAVGAPAEDGGYPNQAYLEEFGASAFEGCSSLDGVEIADIRNWCEIDFLGDDYANPIYVGQKIYHDGELVLRLDIPKGVTHIKDRAFKNATRIVSVTLPSTMYYDDSNELGVAPIGKEAFLYCYKLVEIYNFSKLGLPQDPSSFGAYGYIAAYLKDSIKTYDYWTYPENGIFPYGEIGKVYDKKTAFSTDRDGKRIYASNIYIEDDFLFYKHTNGLYLLGYLGDSQKIFLPELTESYTVFTAAFFGQRNVKCVVIPDSVKAIEHFTFYSCYDLEHVYIPSSVKSFGDRLFGKCTNLVIDVEASEHNVGWNPDWADLDENEKITVNYDQSDKTLEWINDMRI